MSMFKGIVVPLIVVSIVAGKRSKIKGQRSKIKFRNSQHECRQYGSIEWIGLSLLLCDYFSRSCGMGEIDGRIEK